MFMLPLLVLGTCGYVVAPPFRLEESMALRPQLLRVRRGATLRIPEKLVQEIIAILRNLWSRSTPRL